MALGEAGKLKIYVWDTTTGDWIDYGENILELTAEKRKHDIPRLDFRLIGASEAADKALLKRGARVALFVGTEFKGKYRIRDANYHTNYESSFFALMSAGKVNTAVSYTARSLQDEVTGDKTGDDAYSKQATSAIVSDIFSNTITIDATDNGGTTQISAEFDYENKAKALNEICERTDQWWWVDYVGLTNANVGEDTLHIGTAPGSASGETLTIGDDVEFTYNQEDGFNQVTHLIGTGQARNISILQTEEYIAVDDAVANPLVATLVNPIDTLLDADLTEIGLSIVVDDASGLASTGYVKIGGEIINFTSRTSTVLTVPIGGRGSKGTRPTTHKTGEEVINLGQTGDFDDVPVTVTNITGMPSSSADRIRVGSEIFELVGAPTGNVFFCMRARVKGSSTPADNFSGKMYAHYTTEVKVYAFMEGLRASYDLDNPETDTESGGNGSPIFQYGVISKKVAVSTATHLHEIDAKLTYILSNYKSGTHIRGVRVADPFDVLDTKAIKFGDTVTVTDATSGLSGVQRIFGERIKYNRGSLLCELILTEKEKEYESDAKRKAEEAGMSAMAKLKNHLDSFMEKTSDQEIELFGGGVWFNQGNSEFHGYFYKDYNGKERIGIKNPNAGTTAVAEFGAFSDSDVEAKFGVTGSGYTAGSLNDVVYFVGLGTTMQKIVMGSQHASIDKDIDFWSQDQTTRLSILGDGRLSINPAGSGYILPSADGTADQILSTDGSGTVSWVASGTGSSDFWEADGVHIQNHSTYDGYYVNIYGTGGTQRGSMRYLDSQTRFEIATNIGDVYIQAASETVIVDGVTGAPQIVINNDFANVATAEVARIAFRGESSLGTDVVYAFIRTEVNDPTVGAEDGELQFYTVLGGSHVKRMYIDLTRMYLDTGFLQDLDDANNDFYITRLGNTNQSLQILVDDAWVTFVSEQDEESGTRGGFVFQSDDDGTQQPYWEYKHKGGTGALFRIISDVSDYKSQVFSWIDDPMAMSTGAVAEHVFINELSSAVNYAMAKAGVAGPAHATIPNHAYFVGSIAGVGTLAKVIYGTEGVAAPIEFWQNGTAFLTADASTRIKQTPTATSGYDFEIDDSSNTGGILMYVHTDALNTSGIAQFEAESGGGATGPVLTSLNYGTGSALVVNQQGVLASGQHALHVQVNGAQTTSPGALFESTTILSTEDLVRIESNSLHGTGKAALSVYSNASFSGYLTRIYSDNIGASGVTLGVETDGTGKGIFVDHNGSGIPIYVSNTNMNTSIFIESSYALGAYTNYAFHCKRLPVGTQSYYKCAIENQHSGIDSLAELTLMCDQGAGNAESIIGITSSTYTGAGGSNAVYHAAKGASVDKVVYGSLSNSNSHNVEFWVDGSNQMKLINNVVSGHVDFDLKVSGTLDIQASDDINISTTGSIDDIILDAGRDVILDTGTNDAIMFRVSGAARMDINHTIADGVYVDNDLDVGGTLTKGSGSFKIDHPLDPKNKTLRHSFVESPDMLNLYRGEIFCDKRVEVALPDYFWELNGKVAAQLTPVGKGAILSYEFVDDKLIIESSVPCMVSWLVYGNRIDAFALAHPIIVEENKKEPMYIHPDCFT